MNTIKKLWANPVIKTVILAVLGGALGAGGGVLQAGAIVVNHATVSASLGGAAAAVIGLYTQHPTNPGAPK
jgi:hypothetical protein